MKIKKHSFFPFRVLSILVLSFPLTASRILFRGDSLSVKDDDSNHITSPGNTFTCGFYSIGNDSNAYYLAIWYTNSRDKTMVWNAKQDRPVNRQGSRLTLRPNGALVITDVDNTIVWQTNTTSRDVQRVELLETGNLVLKNPQGDILWQSFDLPTDTLLPHQLFTKNHRLVPPLRKGNPLLPGYFSLYFDSDNALRMIYDGPQVSSIYWPNPDWGVYANGRTSQNSTRIAYFDRTGRFFSSDMLTFNVSDVGLGVLRRMTIDMDGNLRIYSLDNSTGLWKISWQAIAQPCIVHGLCGRNSICTYVAEPRCVCPPGYQMFNESDWTRGCRPTFRLRTLNPNDVKFVEIPNVDYWGFDLNATSSMSLESCRELCLEDTRCRVFVYRRNGEGTCYTKGTLFNGYRSPAFPGSVFLKLPKNVSASELGLLNLEGTDVKCGQSPEESLYGTPSMYVLDFKKVKWIYLYVFSSIIGGIEILFVVFGWWALFSKHGIPASIEDGYKMVSSTQFRRFTYTELKKATKKFSIELGRGASGVVYKGVLADGRAIAVKRLANEFQEEFWAEMTTIGRMNHMNLVRMWGFCAEGRHQLLVYEYIENSSLDKHLYRLENQVLGWKQRFAVALGTAKGLAYLHHECLEWVIHCDVKPENILLDGDFEPKIADFGLAKLSQRGGPGSNFTKIRGTKGYMAPEWALNQPITAKVDVYAFGVVILEMVRGSRLSNWVVADDDECHHEQESQLQKFVRMVKRNMQSGDDSWLENIVDPRLERQFSKKQAVTLIEVGVSCVEQDRNKRPTMASVVQCLLDCEDEITMLT